MEIYTQLLDIFTPGNVIYIGEEHHPFTIERTRWKQDLLLLKFEEINDRTTVSGLTNQLVFIQADALPGLPEGDFYNHELLGLEVYEEGGAYLGVLAQVLETGANDVYLVQAEDEEEVLIPAIKEMILEIDQASKRMIVSRMEWYGEGE